ncbi:MAG: FRG domain-containing protein [Lachnospiraceae bacterium]|nr:FRG domain-containing protein [Lachnospiraceae bacterium]
MITEIYIDTLDKLLPLLTEQEYRPDLDRNRSSYLYRGMCDSSYKMCTSLGRNCKELQKQLEPAILESFAKYAINDEPSIVQSVWRQMIFGQHYGLPTRLLDWTQSALVALNFATTEENLSNMDKHDCMVWRINMSEIVNSLPDIYRSAVNNKHSTIFTVDMLKELTGNSLNKYDRDMGDSSMVIIEPPSLNQRIINQHSFFAVVPMGIADIEEFLNKNTTDSVKYIIDKGLRWRIRDMLDQLNMSERIVFPGLEGVSKWIARHYFVK